MIQNENIIAYMKKILVMRHQEHFILIHTGELLKCTMNVVFRYGNTKGNVMN